MPSFLSSNVEKLLIEIGKTYFDQTSAVSTQTYIPALISEDLNLNWTLLETYFDFPASLSLNISEQNFEWFHKQIEKTFPIFAEIHFRLLKQENLDNFFDSCSWTGHREEIEKYWNIFTKSCNNVESLETLLFLTSIFERALGNVFLIKDKNVPFLLRDLLATEAIKSIFGEIPVFFAQLLLGSPRSLNLRNLAWHGFLRNDDIFPCLISSLLALIAAFGKILSNKQITNIPQRKQIKNIISYSQIIESNVTFPILNDRIEEIKDFWEKEPYFEFNRNVWFWILQLYQEKKYGRCLMMLLPQFEHLMRQIYCKINSVESRLLTAETESLYTTFDEIFSKDTENKILTNFSLSLIDLYSDLFSYQLGPRIRDKLSHGEINLIDINERIVTILIYLILGFTSQLTTYKINSNLSNHIDLIRTKYVTCFHQNAVLKRSLQQFSQELNCWDRHLPSEWNKNQKDEAFIAIHNFCSTILKTLQTSDVPEIIDQLQIPSADLPQNETILLLTRISQISIKCNKSLLDVFQEKASLYNQRQLRSRQRKSYEKMIERIPHLYQFLISVLYILTFCTSEIFSHYSNSIVNTIVKYENYWFPIIFHMAKLIL